MAVTEGRRKKLYDKFEEVLDIDNAETVMELLPPVGWADVATNRELDHLRLALEGRFEGRFEVSDKRTLAAIAALRAEMYREFASVRGDTASEFAAVRAEMASEFAAVRAEMASELAAVRDELALSVRTLMVWGTGMCTTLAGLAFTAGHLL